MAFQIESAQKWKFDVFFNFRLQDLDKSFVADLYQRLKDIGTNAFKPDVNSEWGEQISTEILEAIEESRIAITIFSKDYTSSPRCLEELTKIMGCVDNKGQEFFSVYYKCEPLDCLRSIVNFGADLKGSDLRKVQRWKDALRKADDMEGS
ncbi:TMV resistance protein N-like [Solanum tuberosum]|uniref:TMV resistance protein N n=1 Tax=Solanum tuberosum TaxID=4113 RepID=M1D3I4_SOLTU|nr:PREDICTED: TMV resistance protein N-like [Solanum tuberosum]